MLLIIYIVCLMVTILFVTNSWLWSSVIAIVMILLLFMFYQNIKTTIKENSTYKCHIYIHQKASGIEGKEPCEMRRFLSKHDLSYEDSGWNNILNFPLDRVFFRYYDKKIIKEDTLKTFFLICQEYSQMIKRQFNLIFYEQIFSCALIIVSTWLFSSSLLNNFQLIITGIYFCLTIIFTFFSLKVLWNKKSFLSVEEYLSLNALLDRLTFSESMKIIANDKNAQKGQMPFLKNDELFDYFTYIKETNHRSQNYIINKNILFRRMMRSLKTNMSSNYLIFMVLAYILLLNCGWIR